MRPKILVVEDHPRREALRRGLLDTTGTFINQTGASVPRET
ncbi:hypothetical protein DWG14_05757 [Streptomyces griseorubiginosus]|jgi:hypothetical protein|uniref:Uncharacterized protein n=1 Tax=Streptomyces griseorubiginosus TaxID=67304 RepID=A0AAI8L5Q5_9ACTN|nr:hypothetical protein DWG14_05757 [Streptomyces griseorubiginosus]